MSAKFAVVVFLLAVGLSSGLDIVSSRQMPNYGVSIHYMGKINVQAQRWRHQFKVRIPSLDKLYRNVTYCSARDNVCDRTTVTNRYLESLNGMVTKRYNALRKDLRPMFPEQTRAPESDTASYVSQSFESTNLAPFKEANEVLNVDSIQDLFIPAFDIGTYNPLGYLGEDDINSLFSYAHNVQTGLERNDGNMRALARNITQAMRDMTEDSFDVASFLAQSAARAVDALETMGRLQSYAQHLATGKLPAGLVTPTDLTAALDKIRSSVTLSASRYGLSTTATEYYYGLDSIRSQLVGDELCIFVDVPVTIDSAGYLDLYHTEAYPLAASQDLATKSATLLSGFQPYLLLSSDGNSYLELSQDQLDACPGDKLRPCRHQLARVSIKVPSCHLALFRDDFDAINELCTLTFLKNGIKPLMRELEPGLFLMNKVMNPLSDCPKNVLDAIVLTSCQQCLRNIPCQCSISSDYVTSGSRLVEGCQNEVSAETNYTLNLLLLRKAGRDTEGLTGSSRVDLPTVQRLGVTFSEEDLSQLLGNRATSVTFLVENLPSPEAQVEAIPSGMGVGGGVSIVILLFVFVLFGFTVYKWRATEMELRKITNRQAGVDLPIVLNGNGFRPSSEGAEEEEVNNHLMEVETR